MLRFLSVVSSVSDIAVSNLATLASGWTELPPTPEAPSTPLWCLTQDFNLLVGMWSLVTSLAGYRKLKGKRYPASKFLHLLHTQNTRLNFIQQVGYLLNIATRREMHQYCTIWTGSDNFKLLLVNYFKLLFLPMIVIEINIIFQIQNTTGRLLNWH